MESKKSVSDVDVLKEETMSGLNKIISKKYKSQIDNYFDLIYDFYFDEEIDNFEILNIFDNMFSFIEDDFKYNLRILKIKLKEKYKKNYIKSEIRGYKTIKSFQSYQQQFLGDIF